MRKVLTARVSFKYVFGHYYRFKLSKLRGPAWMLSRLKVSPLFFRALAQQRV